MIICMEAIGLNFLGDLIIKFLVIAIAVVCAVILGAKLRTKHDAKVEAEAKLSESTAVADSTSNSDNN